MKAKLFFCLALVLSGGLFGCSTNSRLVVADPKSAATLKLPIEFDTHKQLYAFIAKREGLPMDENTIFKLAADSSTAIYALDEQPLYALVITPHFYNGGIYDTIRGVQGNGNLYVLRSRARDFTSLDTDHGFELVGCGTGNRLRWSSYNHQCRFVTGWHLSAAERPETIYEWNGKFFEQVK